MAFAIDQVARAALEELCRRYAVRRLKLFGSAVGGEFNPQKSDLDFLVEFKAPPEGMRLSSQFFGLLEDMEKLFGRKVDLLEEPAIENSFLRKQAESTSVTLYAA